MSPNQMALKYFLLFAGAFFGGAFMLVAIIRSIVVSFSGTRPLLVGAAVGAGVGIFAYAATFLTDNLFTFFWILAALFLIGGTIHMLLQQRFFTSGSEKTHRLFYGKLLFALAVLFITIIVFSVLANFVGDKFTFYLPALSSGLAFFLPLLFVQSYFLASRIPAAEFTGWQYPMSGIRKDVAENPDDRLLVLGFELTKKPGDTRRINFRAKAPEHIILGDLFYYFINDYNEVQSETPIRYHDPLQQSYSWLFRRRPRWYEAEKVLDPAKNLLENGIKENSVIICERISPDVQ